MKIGRFENKNRSYTTKKSFTNHIHVDFDSLCDAILVETIRFKIYQVVFKLCVKIYESLAETRLSEKKNYNFQNVKKNRQGASWLVQHGYRLYCQKHALIVLCPILQKSIVIELSCYLKNSI